MTSCFPRRKSAYAALIGWLLAAPAFATPALVAEPYDFYEAAEPMGELQPHQKLSVPAAPSGEDTPPPPGDEPISVDPEREISIGSSESILNLQGSIEPNAVGFRVNSWQYLTQREAIALLRNLPQPIELNPLRLRILALLSMKADPPRMADSNWFNARLAALLSLGSPQAAVRLIQSVPDSLSADINPTLALHSYLQSMQPVLACEGLNGMKQPDTIQDDSWQRLALFCRAIKGDFAQVELAMAVAEEAGTPMPDWFIELLEHLQYRKGTPPKAGKNLTQTDRDMLRAIGAIAGIGAKPKAEPVSYPRQPAYAVKAFAELVRAGKTDALGEWLTMMERHDEKSASNYVAHELARFLRTNPKVKSPEAMQIPPFTAVETSTLQQQKLLHRFYHLMEAFDYIPPETTMEWLESHAKQSGFDTTDDFPATSLKAYVEAGNTAGYLLALTTLLGDHDFDALSDETVAALCFDLVSLRQDTLARQLAAHAIVARME